MAVPEEAPSPVIPIIALFIVGTMMTIPSLMTYDPDFWTSTVSEVQTHFVMGAFLIPVCLLLAVQAFGIPRVNPVEPALPSSPFVQSITQNLTTSILLFVVIILLLMLIPLRSALQGPWEPPSSYARNSRW